MGSLYRSELMSLCQLFLHSDTAYDVVAKLGELGVTQFIDLNSGTSTFQRRFIGDLKRCDLMARKLKFIEEEILKDAIAIPELSEFVPAPLPSEMNALEAEFERIEGELLENSRNMKSLLDSYTQLYERMQCINKVQQLLTDGQRQQARQSLLEADHEAPTPGIGSIRRKLTQVVVGKKDSIVPDRKSSFLAREKFDISFVAGIVERRDSAALERLLWRMCGLNVFVRIVTIDSSEDPFMIVRKLHLGNTFGWMISLKMTHYVESLKLFQKDSPPKDAFIVFFYGAMLRLRVKKICACFHAKLYDCPDSVSQRVAQVTSLFGRVSEIKSVIEQTKEHRDTLLQATAYKAREWDIKVQKMRAIFGAMNLFNINITQRCLIAECWIPTADVARVRDTLDAASKETGSVALSFLCEVETSQVPPTYFRVNKFTQSFQNIVDSYGIATYREINPAPWTMVTFPFLFAVMFGDAGHGLIMFLAALTLVLFENKVKTDDEIIGTFFGGRYVILLMGLFSVYTGFIYNDFYSRSLNLFGSSWQNPYNASSLDGVNGGKGTDLETTLPPEYAYDRYKGPYVFGLDPVWNLAENRLTFTNSMKMKASVILGILQMAFGIFLGLMNFLHFRSAIDVFFIFIPQLLFLSCIFIYLCVQIIIKWIMFSTEPGDVFGFFYPGSHCAPSLLIGLINMFMLKPRKEGFWDQSLPGEFEACYLQQWYPNQNLVEKGLLIIAILCIPVMLFVKPVYLKLKFRKMEDDEAGSSNEKDVKFDFADAMVYQAIHTIEFALGCISHTASYLRLWALSLAHAQLSEVLWSMVLNIALATGGWSGGPVLYFISWAFVVLTFTILILMEGLSAFLHALRLHWVEFQSKFYGGQGYPFEAFTFAEIQSHKLATKEDSAAH